VKRRWWRDVPRTAARHTCLALERQRLTGAPGALGKSFPPAASAATPAIFRHYLARPPNISLPAATTSPAYLYGVTIISTGGGDINADNVGEEGEEEGGCEGEEGRREGAERGENKALR